MSTQKTIPRTMWHFPPQQAHQLLIGLRDASRLSPPKEKSALCMDEVDLHESSDVTAANDDWRINSVTAAGLVRHIFAEAKEVELAVLMRSIELGNSPAASKIARRILSSISASAEPGPSNAKARIVANTLTLDVSKPKASMSPRELKVLKLIARGWSNRQISDATHRSINTIEAQIKSVYRKLAVRSRTQAVHEAVQRGLLNLEGQHESAVDFEPAMHCTSACSCATRLP